MVRILSPQPFSDMYVTFVDNNSIFSYFCNRHIMGKNYAGYNSCWSNGSYYKNQTKKEISALRIYPGDYGHKSNILPIAPNSRTIGTISHQFVAY